MIDYPHVPVMLDSIVSYLSPSLSAPGAVYVDGTLGMAGHAEAILRTCENARLVGIDRDPHALERARQRLAVFGDRVTIVEAVFDELPDVLDSLDIHAADAILLDLGLSSLQIDDVDRGFSYSQDAPLDMRMSPLDEVSAATIVNTYSQPELVKILRVYGEERFADRIASRILAAREKAPLVRSRQLVDVIVDAIPMAARKTGGHPAKRTFQALRIAVNHELDVLDRVLAAGIQRLTVGGRFAVLSYHSLEDRPVKTSFRLSSQDSAPPGLPVVPDHLLPQFRVLTRGAQRPTSEEIEANPRSASARLRVLERIRESS